MCLDQGDERLAGDDPLAAIMQQLGSSEGAERVRGLILLARQVPLEDIERILSSCEDLVPVLRLAKAVRTSLSAPEHDAAAAGMGDLLDVSVRSAGRAYDDPGPAADELKAALLGAEPARRAACLVTTFCVDHSLAYRLAPCVLDAVTAEELLRLLSRQTGYPCFLAAKLLIMFGQTPMLHRVVRWLARQDDQTVEALLPTLRALCRRRRECLLDLVAAAEGEAVRITALRALCTAKDEDELRDAVTASLTDDSDEVRLAAAEALAEIGDDAGLPVLEELAQSNALRLSAKAFACLSELALTAGSAVALLDRLWRASTWSGKRGKQIGTQALEALFDAATNPCAAQSLVSALDEGPEAARRVVVCCALRLGSAAFMRRWQELGHAPPQANSPGAVEYARTFLEWLGR